MTTEIDILGRPPIRKQAATPGEEAIDSLPFSELCKPISAKVMPERVLAMSDGYLGAIQSQRREGRR